jgi:hypothetical protein
MRATAVAVARRFLIRLGQLLPRIKERLLPELVKTVTGSVQLAWKFYGRREQDQLVW